MTTYFEYRTIDELIDDNCNFYKQEKEFMLDELSQYNGKNGKPAYIAIEGIVYDISNELIFREAESIEIIAGRDLTEQFNFYNRMKQIINRAPRIGVLDYGNDIEYEINRDAYKQAKQNMSKFDSDQWGDNTQSFRKCAKNERKKHKTGKSCKCQKCISLDAIAGLEKLLQEAITQILELQTKIFKCAETTINAGAASEEIGTIGGAGAKISGVEGSVGGFPIVGGAIGGAGGGLGVPSKNIETSGGFETTTTETKTKLGPGAIGGAAGGALGSTGRSETTDDKRRDRLYFE